MSTNTREIRTGTEHNSDVGTDADIYAYADDGEHATVWEIDRLSDTIIRTQVYRCEAGLADHVGEESYSVDSETATEDWALSHANADPELAVELARDYWGDGDE